MTDTQPLTPESTPEEIRTAWVAALRSGEYLQTVETLREEVETYDEDGERHTEAHYCCLGVLTDLAVKAGIDPDDVIVDRDGNWTVGTGAMGYLPVNVARWADLNPNPVVITGGRGTVCTEANDEYGWSFATIADAVEQTYITRTETPPMHGTEFGYPNCAGCPDCMDPSW